MPPVEFETTISAGERPQTYALDRAATGTGFILLLPLHDLSPAHFFLFFKRKFGLKGRQFKSTKKKHKKNATAAKPNFSKNIY